MSTGKASKKGSTKSSRKRSSSSSSSSSSSALTNKHQAGARDAMDVDTPPRNDKQSAATLTDAADDISDDETVDDGTSMLEQFIDGISALPADIIKSLQLMRELDDQSNGIVNQVRQQIAAATTTQKGKRHFAGDYDSLGSSSMEMDSSEESEEENVTHEYVDQKFQEALTLSEEKIQLSTKCYEEVDKCIRKLDEELARFSRRIGASLPAQEQQQQQMSSTQPNSHIARTIHQNHRNVYDALAGQPHTASAHRQQQQQQKQGQLRTNKFVTAGAGITGTASQSYMMTHLDNNYYRHTGVSLNLPSSTAAPASAIQSSMLQRHPTASYYQQQQFQQESTRRKISSTLPVGDSVVTGPAPTSTSGVFANDMPVDPNEPVYCICQRVSFGDMVACDNDACPYEWFHFQCVGLTESPKGSWYCPHCREQRRGGITSSNKAGVRDSQRR